MQLSSLTFPACCCRCGEPTDDEREFMGVANPGVLGALGQLGGFERTVTIPMPFCADCQRARRRKSVCGVLIGLSIGGILGAGAAAMASLEGWAVSGEMELAWRAALVIAGLCLGALFGRRRLGQGEPVRLRRYSIQDKTVQIWFENPSYRAEVAELLAEQDE